MEAREEEIKKREREPPRMKSWRNANKSRTSRKRRRDAWGDCAAVDAVQKYE